MSANNAFHIAVLGGDGIGPEVMAPALEVLRKVEAKSDLAFRFTEAPAGANHYRETGKSMPDSTIRLCEEADAILLGACGLPSVRYPDNTEIAPQITSGSSRSSVSALPSPSHISSDIALRFSGLLKVMMPTPSSTLCKILPSAWDFRAALGVSSIVGCLQSGPSGGISAARVRMIAPASPLQGCFFAGLRRGECRSSP